jgi:riboflavin kinase/FMN adenylyltransferase
MVVDGNKLGRTLGYPTANVIIHDQNKLVPANGIYVAETEIISQQLTVNRQPILKGMMSIGVRPTVDGKNRTIELNIFDFNEDIYGKTLKVFVLEYLRPEVKFDSLDALKLQIDKDKENSLKYFEGQAE